MSFPDGSAVKAVLIDRLVKKLKDFEHSGEQKITLCIGYSVAILTIVFDELDNAVPGSHLSSLVARMKEAQGFASYDGRKIRWDGLPAGVNDWDRLRFLRNRLAHFNHDGGGFQIVDKVDGIRGFSLTGSLHKSGNDRWVATLNRRHLTRVLVSFSKSYLKAFCADNPKLKSLKNIERSLASIEKAA